VHESTQVRPRGLDRQVDVIAHQAKQVQPHLELLDAFSEPANEALPVGVVPEDGPPLIAYPWRTKASAWSGFHLTANQGACMIMKQLNSEP
jgi:hypothetical protein